MTKTQIVRQAQRLTSHRGYDPRNSQPMVQRNISLLNWLLDQHEFDLSEADYLAIVGDCERTQPLPALVRPQAF